MANTTLTPWTGTVTFAGLALALSLQFSIAPDVGAATLTGKTATSISNTVRTPGTGAVLTVAGYGPTDLEEDYRTPGAATATLTGFAPGRVSKTYRAPAVGAMAFTFNNATVNQLIAATLTPGKRNGFRTAAITTEQWIRKGACRVYGVYPEVASTAGTITLRNTGGPGGSTPVHICPAATLSAGKYFGEKGIDFPDGLSVQISNSADLTLIFWEAV